MIFVSSETRSTTDGPPTGGTMSVHMRSSIGSKTGHQWQMKGHELHEILALAGQRGLSYNDIGERCHVAKSAVSRWAGGHETQNVGI